MGTPQLGCDITPIGCDITPQQQGVHVHPKGVNEHPHNWGVNTTPQWRGVPVHPKGGHEHPPMGTGWGVPVHPLGVNACPINYPFTRPLNTQSFNGFFHDNPCIGRYQKDNHSLSSEADIWRVAVALAGPYASHPTASKQWRNAI